MRLPFRAKILLASLLLSHAAVSTACSRRGDDSCSRCGIGETCVRGRCVQPDASVVPDAGGDADVDDSGIGSDAEADAAFDAAPACDIGRAIACYTGPPATEGLGVCHAGSRLCARQDGGAIAYSGCVGEVTPIAEEPDNDSDDDCDGQEDEPPGDCWPPDTADCYPGPADVAGVGACTQGTRTCVATTDVGVWSDCEGLVLPVREIDDNEVDDDCDGSTDEITPVPSHGTALAFDGTHFALGYVDRRGDGDYDAYVVLLDSSGVPTSRDLRVNEVPISSPAAVPIRIGWNGSEYGVTYMHDTPYGLRFRRVSADGDLVGDEIVAVTGGVCGPPHIEWDGGEWIAGQAPSNWQPPRLLFIGPSGDTFTTALDAAGAIPCSGIQVVAGEDGYAMAWTTRFREGYVNHCGIKFVRLDLDGAFVGDATVVDEMMGCTPADTDTPYWSVALRRTGSAYQMVFSRLGSLVAVELDSSGTELGRSSLAAASYPIVYSLTEDGSSSLAVYTDTDGIHFIGVDGDTLGSPALVGGSNAGGVVAVEGASDVAVAFHRALTPGGNLEVYFARATASAVTLPAVQVSPSY